ncbi:MAG: nickel pincer cofactor biosynthesis protein LarC [Bacteroidales bacterium]
MKIAYFDCFSGIAGDMLIASLLDAGLDFAYLENEVAKLGLGKVNLKNRKLVKQNISSTYFEVEYEDQHHHRHLKDLNNLVENRGLPEDIVEKAKKVFLSIAEAEARIHDMPLEKVHFHEVGAIDTIVDVVCALLGFKKLGIEKVVCSPLNVGSGFVTFSHGKFPVPAPATAEILRNIPTYSTNSQGELVTPTGAAVITTLADSFGDMPSMMVESIGYGAGTKDFEHPNVLRVYIGKALGSQEMEEIIVIETNIDDMNPQFYEPVMEKLFREGALDVFFTPIQMKKNRPATKLTVLSKTGDEKKLTSILLKETTSLGVRMRKESRMILERESIKIQTPYGEVNMKISGLKGEVYHRNIEYEDLRRISSETGESLQVISEKLRKYTVD